jgi:alpha-beta hydrolase superfamily lysophospholipase
VHASTKKKNSPPSANDDSIADATTKVGGAELRYSFTFAPDGKSAAALFHSSGGQLEVEAWRLRTGSWKPTGTGVRIGVDDQILPLRDGRILVRAGSGRGHVLVLVGPPSANAGSHKWSIRALTELPFSGVRLISAAPSDRNALAVVVTHDDGTTRLWRLLLSGELVSFPLEVAGLCKGGVWLDRCGRRLAINRSVEGRPSTAIIIDLSNQSVETLFDIGPHTADRVDLYSLHSSLVVVSTDAGGAERIGFAHLREGESLWFPEETSAPTGVRALALDPIGERLLLHEQRGVLSRLAVYDVIGRRRQALVTPRGCIRGQATWNKHGISVPWSTPMTPHTVLRRDVDSWSAQQLPEPADRIAQVVAVNGAAEPLEGIVYGGSDWRLNPRLVVALHGGPVDAWRYEYDPLFQALAKSDIAVLAVNQRGSAGYGPDHVKPIRGAWGGPDLEDVKRVIRELTGSRGALGGPAVLGISYGAYLALLAACVIPEYLTACVAFAPFLSAERLYKQGGTETLQHIDRLDGRREIVDHLGSRDVLRLADRLVVRCLLVHGRDDDVIPVEQSRTLCERLSALGRRRGRHFEYLEIENAGHDLLNGPTAETVRMAVCEFLTESVKKSVVVDKVG